MRFCNIERSALCVVVAKIALTICMKIASTKRVESKVIERCSITLWNPALEIDSTKDRWYLSLSLLRAIYSSNESLQFGLTFNKKFLLFSKR